MKRNIIFIILSIAAVFPFRISAQRELPLPAIPDSLETRQQKMTYLMTHFWDAMDWNDPALERDSLFLEQNLSNFFSVMAVADSISSSEGVRLLLKQSHKRPGCAEQIAELAETYLYNPASPYLNAESYLAFADCLRNDSLVDESVRSRADFSYGQIMKNRKGHTATDFRFVDRNGNERLLSDIRETGTRCVLFFYDTDCRDCHEIAKRMAMDGTITRLVATGELQIIAIDAYGADPIHWQSDADTWPREWTIGRSPEGEIDADEIYVLRTSPTIYLLSPDNRVIAKELTFDRLLETVKSDAER